jgi:hypothetical protein
MAASTSWTDIRDNFIDLMRYDVNEVTTNQFKYYTGGIDFTKKSALPASNWNGAYTLNFGGMTSSEEINGYFYPNYRLMMQIGFSLNERNGRTSYDTAIVDLENIVRLRLITTSWGTNIIRNILHMNTSEFGFYNVENETFGIVTIEFNVIGQTLLKL